MLLLALIAVGGRRLPGTGHGSTGGILLIGAGSTAAVVVVVVSVGPTARRFGALFHLRGGLFGAWFHCARHPHFRTLNTQSPSHN